jgi:hypothetical protein
MLLATEDSRPYNLVSRGALAQLVRAPPCHGGGCGFEPRRLRGFHFAFMRSTESEMKRNRSAQSVIGHDLQRRIVDRNRKLGRNFGAEPATRCN